MMNTSDYVGMGILSILAVIILLTLAFLSGKQAMRGEIISYGCEQAMKPYPRL